MSAPKIVTHCIYPPIPMRQFDWVAFYEDDEPNGNGWMASGYGPTSKEAIADLVTEYPREQP